MAMRGFRLPRRRPAMWFDRQSLVRLPSIGITDYIDFTCDFFALPQQGSIVNAIFCGIYNNGVFGFCVPYTNRDRITVQWRESSIGWGYHFTGVTFADKMTSLRIIVDFSLRKIVIEYDSYSKSVAASNINFFSPLAMWNIGGISNGNSGNLSGGCLRNIIIRDRASILADYRGDGITDANWSDPSYPGTVYGNPERCLVHTSGAVIRTDPGTGDNYVVR